MMSSILAVSGNCEIAVIADCFNVSIISSSLIDNKAFEQDYTDFRIIRIYLKNYPVHPKKEVKSYFNPSSPKTTFASHSLGEGEFGVLYLM